MGLTETEALANKIQSTMLDPMELEKTGSNPGSNDDDPVIVDSENEEEEELKKAKESSKSNSSSTGDEPPASTTGSASGQIPPAPPQGNPPANPPRNDPGFDTSDQGSGSRTRESSSEGLRKRQYEIATPVRITLKKYMADGITPRCQSPTTARTQCTYSEEQCWFHDDNSEDELQREENKQLKREVKQAEKRARKKQKLEEQRQLAIVDAHNSLRKVNRINESLKNYDQEFAKLRDELKKALE